MCMSVSPWCQAFWRCIAPWVNGRAVQADSIKTRLENTYGFSA